MIDVMNLIKQRKTDELNSPIIHQKVLKSIHRVSKDEISRTATTLSLIAEHLKAKKQAQAPTDILPVYLVF